MNAGFIYRSLENLPAICQGKYCKHFHVQFRRKVQRVPCQKNQNPMVLRGFGCGPIATVPPGNPRMLLMAVMVYMPDGRWRRRVKAG